MLLAQHKMNPMRNLLLFHRTLQTSLLKNVLLNKIKTFYNEFILGPIREGMYLQSFTPFQPLFYFFESIRDELLIAKREFVKQRGNGGTKS